MNPWVKGLLWLSTGLTGAVLIKLGTTGLFKIYRLLFAYLACDFLSSIVASLISYHSNAYGYYYFSAQTMKILIAVFMLREIYGMALERTPALAQYGRNAIGYLWGLAALIPVIFLFLNRSGPANRYFKAFLLFEQTTDATMAIFLILISVFMAWFPVRMRRNVIIYSTGFVVWTLSRSATVHLITLFPSAMPVIGTINAIQACIAVGCLLFWLFELRREGEMRTAVVGHLWNRAEAERLTEQLNAINDGLTRLRRK